MFFSGVGPAYDRVGTKDSIMIRVPDHTVTAHLCEFTGPLAITSANPSGESDSVHHDMVIRCVTIKKHNKCIKAKIKSPYNKSYSKRKFVCVY